MTLFRKTVPISYKTYIFDTNPIPATRAEGVTRQTAANAAGVGGSGKRLKMLEKACKKQCGVHFGCLSGTKTIAKNSTACTWGLLRASLALQNPCKKQYTVHFVPSCTSSQFASGLENPCKNSTACTWCFLALHLRSLAGLLGATNS